MRREPFGPTGAAVPVVGQGTWNMERDDRAAAVAALRAGLDLGMTHIDTAELYGSGRVEELERAAALAGAERIACHQVLYHLEERTIEHALVPWCVAHGIAVVGYSPFGSGHFPGPRSRGGRVLAEIAAAHGATPHQVALAFLVRSPGLFTIPKAARAAHVAENARAGDLALSAEDVRRIDAAFPRRPWRGLPML